jgi:hypothetical protein
MIAGWFYIFNKLRAMSHAYCGRLRIVVCARILISLCSFFFAGARDVPCARAVLLLHEGRRARHTQKYSLFESRAHIYSSFLVHGVC